MRPANMFKRFAWIAIAWLALHGDGRAQACVPKTWLTPSAAGTDWIVSIKPAGDAFAWWCPDAAVPGQWRGVTYACLKAYCPADWLLIGLAGAGAEKLLARVDAMAVLPADADEQYRFDMLHYQACKLLEAAPPPGMQILQACRPPLAPPPTPAPVWVVKANGAATTRPAYGLASGVRGSSEVARAPIGQRCDVARPTLASGADLWAEFGPDFRPGVVALCSK